MARFAAFVVAAVAGSALLSACGGGSGGGLGATGSAAWAQMAGNDGNTVGTGIALFADGSMVAVGAYDGNAVFAPNTPQESTLVAGPALGVYLARYDVQGKLVWTRRAVGTSYAQAMGVVTHPDGSFTTTGFFDGSLTLGAGEPAETTLVASAGEDVFVARYLGNGRLVWAKSAIGSGYEEATRLAGFPDGSVAVTGLYTASMTLGFGEPNETTLPPSLSVDGFLAKYSPTGALAWATSFSATGGTSGWGVAAISDGGVALAGSFAGAAVIGAGEPNETDLQGVGASLDVLVARFDSAGDLVWARSAGNAGDDVAYGVAVTIGDDVLVTGVFGGDAVFGAEGLTPVTIVGYGGTTDAFACSYGADGTFLWARAFGATGNDVATAIQPFADGTFVVTGTIAGAATFGAGELGETHPATAGIQDQEVFVARFQPDGNVDWVAVSEGVAGSDNEGTAIATAADGSCVATGYFIDRAQFGAGFVLIGHTAASLNGVGDHDAFIAHYSPSGQF